MPKVGKKHYAYTAAGKAAAKREAKKTGKKMTRTKKYQTIRGGRSYLLYKGELASN